jgi:hypothetical protein
VSKAWETWERYGQKKQAGIQADPGSLGLEGAYKLRRQDVSRDFSALRNYILF